MNDKIQRALFFDTLVEINHLRSFKEWFFYQGMLFGSLAKWWGRAGDRPASHEGLDISFYKDTNNSIQQLNNPVKIPVVADGTIIEISDDDFLGSSVFVRHKIFDKNSKRLHSVYAHSKPLEGIHVGDNVQEGDVIATIADISSRKLSISGHLHISMLWLSQDYPNELLKWQILPNSTNAILADPFEFLDCKYSTDKYQPEDRV